MLRNSIAPAFVAAVLGAAGCSADKAAPGGGGSGAAPAPRTGAGEVTLAALMARPLEPVSDKIKDRAFTITAPIDMKVEHSDTFVSWTIPTSFELPSMSVVVGLPMREGQLGSAVPMGQDAAERVIARNEVLADGGFIRLDHRTDGRFFKLEVCRPIADASLCCSVIQRVTSKRPPIPDLPAVEAWAERICLSMKSS